MTVIKLATISILLYIACLITNMGTDLFFCVRLLLDWGFRMAGIPRGQISGYAYLFLFTSLTVE